MKLIWNKFILIIIFFFLLLKYQSIFSQNVEIGWSPSPTPNVLYYNFYRTNHIDSSFMLIKTVNHPDSNFVDEDIEWSSQYYYVATAVDQAGNESGFSNIIDTTISYPIPVVLKKFSIKLHGASAILEWSTVTEAQNYGFDVQRSQDGMLFSKVGFVKGYGTSQQEKHYIFVDYGLAIGIYHYRLKQINYNGDYEFSQTIKIAIGLPKEFHLEQNYPNPFNTSTIISYCLPNSSLVELSIYNIYGQLIEKLVDEFQEAGRYAVKWNGFDKTGKKVVSGIYYYKIATCNLAMFRKMIYAK